MSDRVCGLLAEPARKGIVEAAECKFYAGGGELRRLREQSIIRIIFFARQCQRRAKNHRNALGTQQILYFVSFSSAGQNHFQFLLFTEFHGIAYVARLVRENEDGQLATSDWHESIQLDVALKIAGTAVAQRLRIMTRPASSIP